MSELVVKPFCDWQVGDTVRCVDSRASSNLLTRGAVYKIRSVDTECAMLTLYAVYGQWSADRFECVHREVEPPTVAAPNPYADWKSGDSVRCLDATGSHEMLAENHVYEIEHGPFAKSDKDRIQLVGLSGYEWNCERFERVAPIVDVHSEPDKPVVRVGSRVRCDDASGTGSWLVEGGVYTVASVNLHDCDTFVRLNDAIGMGWDISRFTLLPDEVAPVVSASQADLTDAVLMPADVARRLADEHFMEHGRELRLEIKAAIDAAVANGEYRANVHMSDSVYGAAQRWLAKSEYRLSSGDPGFTRRTISWQ